MSKTTTQTDDNDVSEATPAALMRLLTKAFDRISALELSQKKGEATVEALETKSGEKFNKLSEHVQNQFEVMQAAITPPDSEQANLQRSIATNIATRLEALESAAKRTGMIAADPEPEPEPEQAPDAPQEPDAPKEPEA